MAEKGKHLDLTSQTRQTQKDSNSTANRYLGIHFVCCDVYARVYANHKQTAYVGHCPRCAKRVQFQIGSGGTDSRFFKAF